MDLKWVFMLITFSLIFVLGLIIAGLQKKSVMNNWSSRRCDIPVMMASMFFKPDSDSRTNSDFAKDNFDFCMKSYIDKFMSIFMTPINTLFGKQANVANGAIDMVNTVRLIAQKLYNTLLSYLDQYYKRFNASVYEISRIAQYLRMAMRRANAMVLSMVYTGLTIFRGMLNTIQFIIKVVLIICGIMLAIIIILIFVLFPFIPMILAVLGSIIAAVIGLSMVISGEIANEASGDRSGFCFADNTVIQIQRRDDNNTEKIIYSYKTVNDIKIGDELANGCGKITSVIKMHGKNIKLYQLNGIYVSGSHLVLGTDNEWKSVSNDERAIYTDNESEILYCFNTTTHKIPVYSDKLKQVIYFRDWEELKDDDIKGQFLWNYTILKILNNSKDYDNWKTCLSPFSEIPILGNNIKVKTQHGYTTISKLNILDEIIDKEGNIQKVLGVVCAYIDGIDGIDKNNRHHINNGIWHTELYELHGNTWIKGKKQIHMQSKLESDNMINNENSAVLGFTIITDSGHFIIWDEDNIKEKIVRDFTDIGHNEIYKTYPLVASRLRL